MLGWMRGDDKNSFFLDQSIGCFAPGAKSKVHEMLQAIHDGLVKSPGGSLRGARRRGNPMEIQRVMRLPRFAPPAIWRAGLNDKSAFFGLFAS